jgi:hypothetical protein
MTEATFIGAYRRARSIGFAATAAKQWAADAFAKYRETAADYARAVEMEEAARVAANEAKATAQRLASEGGPRYEAAAAEVTERVAALDKATRTTRAMLKAATAARVRCYAPGRDYGPGTWQGGNHKSMAAGPRGHLFATHEDGAQGAIRNAEDATAGLDHNGWYDNPHGEAFRDGTGLVIPMVAQLRGRDGRAVYVGGYRFGGYDDSGTFDMRNQFEAYGDCAEDAKAEATFHADGMAEAAAESEREYQSAWGAGQAWRDAMEDETAARREALEILKQRRAAICDAGLTDPAYFALCDTIRRRVSELRETINESRAKREELAQGDCAPFFFYTGADAKELRAAFCEGANLDSFPS